MLFVRLFVSRVCCLQPYIATFPCVVRYALLQDGAFLQWERLPDNNSRVVVAKNGLVLEDTFGEVRTLTHCGNASAAVAAAALL